MLKSQAAAMLMMVCLACVPANAMFVMMDEDVPVDQIVKQVEKIIKDKPKDAAGYYVLGRVHSLAWASGGNQITLTPKKDGLPSFGPTQSVRVQPTPVEEEQKRAPDAAALKHLDESIANYRKAVELDPKNGLYHLGLAWMLEQKLAIKLTQIKASDKSDKDATGAYAKEILALYVKAFDLTIEHDRKLEDQVSVADLFVSAEAAEDALRLMEKFPGDLKDDDLRKRLEKGRDEIAAKPMAVTPIVIATAPGATLASLINPVANVAFDLSGLDTGHRWPWVQPTTGVLVWDPRHTGRITSGRQLFGSMTWQMLFHDGYEALAMLDADHDGSLAGEELNPIGVWFDGNSNGVSDAGEVSPARDAGIAALAVHSTRDAAGTLTVEKGVTWRDGRVTPSYDWVPTSHPVEAAPAK